MILRCTATSTARPRTLNPHEAIEEVEPAPRVRSRAPVRTSYLVGFLSEAGVLSDFILYVRRKGTVLVGLKDDT